MARWQEIILSQDESAGMLPSDKQPALIDMLATAIDRAGEGKLAEGYAARETELTRAGAAGPRPAGQR